MLTRKQLALLDFIREYMAKEGIGPSFDEMRDALDLKSKSGVHRLVSGLEERGYLRRLPHRARAMEICKLPEAMERAEFKPRVIAGGKPEQPRTARPVDTGGAIEVAVMGRIAAGTPIEAISTLSHHVSVPGSMLSVNGQHYALEVKGDSMIELGINDGDIVVIREQITAENGDIVVALVEDQEATLKRFRRRNDMIALEAANPAYETRVLRDDQVKVQGRLVGLIRSY